jgi:hypothetical protein
MITTIKQFPDCTGQEFAAFIPAAIPEEAGYYRLEDNHVLRVSEGKAIDLCLPYHPANECFNYTHPNAKIQEIAAGRLMVFRLPRTHVFLHRFKWHGFPYLHISGGEKFQACIMHHVEKTESGDEFFVNFIHNRILVHPNFFTLTELQNLVAPTSIPQT